MTYTTLTYQGLEKSLADWGISNWHRLAQNQGKDELTFTIPTPMDGGDVFPYGAQIIIKINRTTSAVNPVNPTLPQSGSTSFSGGTQWFWGYCIDNDRTGEPGAESFVYTFAGPYQFFFERLIFQKLQLTWNGAKQIADYQSDVILGLSLSTLTGSTDTVPDTTATNLMSIAQQIKEISAYAQADSAYQQSNNGLGWPGTNQFSCDQLTTAVDGINWDLLATPSANVLISDYAGTPLSSKTSASSLPAGSYMLRCPLDAANAITCAEALRRQLQWLGGIGSPVVWMDHSQTPPQLRIIPRNALPTTSLALAGVTVKTTIKKRTDLIPAAVHFKYKVNGSYLGQPYSVVLNDVAAYIGGSLVEGIGQLGALTSLGNSSISSGNQTTLMAEAKTATAVVQTFDFQGDQINAASCKIVTTAINLADPASGGSTSFWASLFPELGNVTGLKFFDATNDPVTVKDAVSGATIDTTVYVNRVIDGQVAPWMLASATPPSNPVGGKAVKAVISARFAYQENLAGAHHANGPAVGYHEKNITVTLTSLSSGTYYSSPSVAFGEPVPYGLAGYILALESIPQYQGSILVQETEISDVCPLGQALNLTGGLAEWATMNACVQSARYADNGQTEITFGPAAHLGPAQFVARFRSNIGPRWFNLIAGDPMNQSNPGNSALGNNLPAQAPSAGAKQFTFQSFYTNLLNVQSASPPSLPGGTHLDSGAAATPFTGSTPTGTPAFGTGPAVVLANGPGATGGESQAWIRLSLADLKNSSNALQNLHICLREEPYCKNVGGTLTSG